MTNVTLPGATASAVGEVQPDGSTITINPTTHVISAAGGPVATTLVPAWLTYLCTAANGAFNCTTGTCTASGERNYTTFNVSSGATVNVNSSAGLIVHATGATTVNGTIEANGATCSGGSGLTYAVGGGPSGGSGGGTAAGTAGAFVAYTPLPHTPSMERQGRLPAALAATQEPTTATPGHHF